MKQNNNNISLPKNIKQMGNIDENLKIYMEDYVFTFLQQYSKSCNNEERIAVLIGESYNIDGNDVLFISGAIKGEHTTLEDGMVKLTDESFKYIEEQIETYFKGCNIVGWFYSQPGFSDYINDGYINYHKQYFDKKNQVFFLSDPIENIGGFYILCDNDFKALSGFIIYYEKNDAMSEYMSNNKTTNTRANEDKLKAKDERLMNMSRRKNNINKSIHSLSEYKKMTNIFGSLSAVLFLVCFIMGAGLIQSDDKIAELEKRLVKLDDSYRYILSQIKDDNVQSVFAQNDTKNESSSEQTSSLSTANTHTTEKSTVTTTSMTENLTVSTTQEKKDKISETTSESISKNIEKQNLKKYEVKEGDTLELISKRFYGDRSKIEEIMSINGLDNPHTIYVGKTLLLP